MLLRWSLSCCRLWVSACERGAGEKTCCDSTASTSSWGCMKKPSRRSCKCHTSGMRSCLYLSMSQENGMSVSWSVVIASSSHSANKAISQSINSPINHPSMKECIAVLGLVRGVNRHMGNVCALSRFPTLWEMCAVGRWSCTCICSAQATEILTPDPAQAMQTLHPMWERAQSVETDCLGCRY